MGTSAPTRNWSNFISKSGGPVCRPYAQRQQTTARQSQAQNGNRTGFNFPLSQPPVGRQEFRWPLRFCAPEILFYLTGTRPHVNGGSRGRAAWRQGRRSRFCRLRPPPSGSLVTFWPSRKSLAAGAAKSLRIQQTQSKICPLIRPSVRTGAPSPQGEGLLRYPFENKNAPGSAKTAGTGGTFID